MIALAAFDHHAFALAFAVRYAWNEAATSSNC